MADTLMLLDQCVRNGRFIEDTVEPSFFWPGIISLFTMCTKII